MNRSSARIFQGLILCLFLFAAACACRQSNSDMDHEKDPKHTNALIHEDSPYLLQHAHNPVDWMPWGDEAFEKAKVENKLVLISIGYSSCHWCHVMAHESFEDEQVAAVMNEHFVCIKVDREERPDVDQIYMTAVQLMTGSGGWPLNCFTLPDGRPIFGGTYFSKLDWTKILKNLHESYAEDPVKFEEYAEKLTAGVAETELIDVPVEGLQIESEKLDEMVVNWKRTFDPVEGGPNRAPKFPMPNNWDFLMQYAYHTMDSVVMDHVDLTLEKMALGGIYDQIGGGFARYSTDKHWKVPHFEKMLYDNAQLVSLYAHAYQRQHNPLYKRVVYQTLDWVKREMTTEDGAFYSALDADSEGEEGKFYVWSKDELKEVLGGDFDFAEKYYALDAKGLWEGNYILLRSGNDTNFAFENNMQLQDVHNKVDEVNQKLLEARDKRVRPGLDDKALTSWNAMMMIGYLDAYQAFGEKEFLSSAIVNAKWLIGNQLSKDGKLLHSYKNGKSKIDGFLEDYSFSIEAFIKLYEVTFDERWLEPANLMMTYVLEHFHDAKSGMFYFTSDVENQLVTRKMEINDNVIPASNSSIAKCLWKLGTLYDKENYKEMSRQMLANVYEGMEQWGSSYSNWGILGLNMTYPFYEVAITGPGYEKHLKELSRHYVPNKLLMGGENGTLPLLEGKETDEATLFVCVNKACRLPVTNVADALGQLRP